MLAALGSLASRPALACLTAASLCVLLLTACGNGVARTRTGATPPATLTVDPTMPTPTAAAATSPTPVPTASALRACTSADVTANAAEQGATGEFGGSLTVRNIATDPCTLRTPADGIPVLRIKDASGRTLRLDLHSLPDTVPVDVLQLAPGRAASVPFIWENWCDSPPAAPLSVALGVPGALDEIAAKLAGGAAPRCDDDAAPSVLSVGAFTRTPE